MSPYELNITISLLTNFLFANLPRNDYRIVNVLVSELGKSMFSMELLRDICDEGKNV